MRETQLSLVANLRRNLYRGGIAEETLAVRSLVSNSLHVPIRVYILTAFMQILITDDAPADENGSATNTRDETSAEGAFFMQQTASMNSGGGVHDYTFGRNPNYTPRSDLRSREGNANGFHTHSRNNDDFAFMPDGPDGPDGFYDGGSGNNGSQSRLPRQQYDKFAKRTVLLANLPENTTHLDLVDAIRGGRLLDLYLRAHDRTASVSFLEEAAAHDFFRHVKRHDLYIKGKRVCKNLLTAVASADII